ncbi:hypothetical protein CK203_036599 [Vitis vinifera]|uniref:Uncharacterized protein n=1 Tax=Vitis vinifera TaxID=29760 RepID=A0A438HIN2_VITVI|nr:hypothetical protein CK203_036599 [Vitis vinifera]
MVLYKVGLLQATNIMQLCHGNDDDPRRGLLPMEQRPEFAVLRVRFVQGRGAGTHKKRLAQALSSQHCDAGLAHWYLLNWMLCFQKHEKIRNRLPIRRKPDVQSPTPDGISTGGDGGTTEKTSFTRQEAEVLLSVCLYLYVLLRVEDGRLGHGPFFLDVYTVIFMPAFSLFQSIKH